MPDVVVFQFDPYLRLDPIAVRWETLGIAGALLVALVAMAVLAGRTPAGRASVGHLRRDDLLFVALGVVPGAIVGGRIGYALLHLDYYLEQPGAILDPTQGGLQLSLAVAGGAVTAGYVASLLGAPVGRWLHAAALPLLLAIEGGKAAMAWGGSGQGALSSGPLATAYLGPGPWGSLAPELPAVPSQLLEAGATAAVAVALALALAAGGFRRLDGRAFVVAMGGWLAARLVVASTWRDPAILGPLGADQVISLALLLALVPVTIALARLGSSPASDATIGAGSAPTVEWPTDQAAGSWRDG